MFSVTARNEKPAFFYMSVCFRLHPCENWTGMAGTKWVSKWSIEHQACLRMSTLTGAQVYCKWIICCMIRMMIDHLSLEVR